MQIFVLGRGIPDLTELSLGHRHLLLLAGTVFVHGKLNTRYIAGGSASCVHSRGRMERNRRSKQYGDVPMPTAPCSIHKNNPDAACMYAVGTYLFILYVYERKRKHSTAKNDG